MSTESTSQNNKSDRENNLSSTEHSPLPETPESIESPRSPRVSKNSQAKKSNDTYYHEDAEFEYYRVSKKGSNKQEQKTAPVPARNPDPDELIKNMSLDDVPDIQDVSFKGTSLVGGSALNLRF
jgi:hypothetical protein